MVNLYRCFRFSSDELINSTQSYGVGAHIVDWIPESFGFAKRSMKRVRRHSKVFAFALLHGQCVIGQEAVTLFD